MMVLDGSEGTTKVVTIHPEGDTNVCTKCNCSPSIIVETFRSKPNMSTCWWR